MEHKDHVNLLRAGVPAAAGRWADLGAGSGAFTLALADLLPPGSEIHAVDKDRRALDNQAASMKARFPDIVIHYHTADFTHDLNLPLLDGIVMANALHFVREKEPVLRALIRMLKPGGRFMLVEYNVDQGNTWVPYPLSFSTWHQVVQKIGLVETRLLASVPSRFLGEIFSALSFQPTVDLCGSEHQQ